MINKVVLVGRLTKDVELRKTANSTSVVSFTLACNRRFASNQNNGGPTADFINCVAWRQSADFLAKYAHKGDVIGLEGSIQTRSYDGQNGKVYVTEVVADNVQMISNSRSGNASASPREEAPAPSYNRTFTPKVETAPVRDDDDLFSNTPSLEISSDDLPFY